MTDTNEVNNNVDEHKDIHHADDENAKLMPKPDAEKGDTATKGAKGTTTTNDKPSMVPKIPDLTQIDLMAEVRKARMAFFSSLFECVAMFFFIFLICMSGFDASKFILGMWIVLTVFGKFSGGHVNPAITLGVWISSSDFTFIRMLMYWAFQLLGALLGLMAAEGLLGEVKWFVIPEHKSSWTRILVSEAFLTGTFVFVVLFQASDITKSSKSGAINTLIMVAWFYFIAEIGGDVTGGAYNPAALIAVNFYAFKIGKDKNAVKGCGRLILAEFVGAIFFSVVYRFFFLNPYITRHVKEEEKD